MDNLAKRTQIFWSQFINHLIQNKSLLNQNSCFMRFVFLSNCYLRLTTEKYGHHLIISSERAFHLKSADWYVFLLHEFNILWVQRSDCKFFCSFTPAQSFSSHTLIKNNFFLTIFTKRGGFQARRQNFLREIQSNESGGGGLGVLRLHFKRFEKLFISQTFNLQKYFF